MVYLNILRNVMTEKDIKVLEFLYNRLVNVYNENKNYDYMLRFNEIISKLKTNKAIKDKIND